MNLIPSLAHKIKEEKIWPARWKSNYLYSTNRATIVCNAKQNIQTYTVFFKFITQKNLEIKRDYRCYPHMKGTSSKTELTGEDHRYFTKFWSSFVRQYTVFRYLVNDSCFVSLSVRLLLHYVLGVLFSSRNSSTLRRGSLPQQKSKSSPEFQLTEVRTLSTSFLNFTAIQLDTEYFKGRVSRYHDCACSSRSECYLW